MDFYSMFDEFDNAGAQQQRGMSSENNAPNDNTTNNTTNNQNLGSMKFELPEQSSIIKVIGVGGGGSNAVNYMYRQGINGVDFIVCNTDKQALDISPVPLKLVLGATLTEGRGAGSIPEVGRNAAIETIEDLRSVLSNNTKMLFITAGMGGGTGTGAAPIIAGIARELGILTVAIVTVPFSFEGKKRRAQAEEGIEQLKQCVDTLLVICNDKLREMHGNLKLSEAFAHADNVLNSAARSIAEIISLTQQINVDFADVCTVMRNSGVAIMGSATTSGENRAVRATEMALNSPLLNDNNITGARYVLLNIVSGVEEITMDELGEITDYIQEAAGQTAEIIKGYGVDPSLGDSVSVTIIATGFNSTSPVAYEFSKKQQAEKVMLNLEEPKVENKAAEVVAPKTEEVRNELEPFLVSSAEPKAEVVTPVAPVNNVPEVTNEEPRHELEPFLVTRTEEPKAEVITKTEEPVINQVAEIEFEVTNNSVEEVSGTSELDFTSENSEEPVGEIETWEEQSVESVSEETVSMETTVEPVAEVTEQPVAEVNEQPTVIQQQPVVVAEVESKQNDEEKIKQLQQEEQMRKAQERIMKLKELSLKLKTPNGLSELENEPAYKRRNVQLSNESHSSESQVSRYTLSENDEKKADIRPNNSFLHDNVD